MSVEQARVAEPVPARSPRCWIVPLLLLTAFGCGLLAGVCGTLTAMQTARHRALAAPELVMEQQLARMAKELAFTPVQVSQAQAIFRRRHNRVLAKLLETRDFLMVQLEELEHEMTQVVSPEQQAGLAAHFSRLRRELPPFREPPPRMLEPAPADVKDSPARPATAAARS